MFHTTEKGGATRDSVLEFHHLLEKNLNVFRYRKSQKTERDAIDVYDFARFEINSFR